MQLFKITYFSGVECGDIPILPSSNRTVPQVTLVSRVVGGRGVFSCRAGYKLKGPSESTCLPSGEWSLPFPICEGRKQHHFSFELLDSKEKNFFLLVEVKCLDPGNPENGYAQGSPPYRAGDLVQFNCNREYMMQGQPIIACQDNGRWSGEKPKCMLIIILIF